MNESTVALQPLHICYRLLIMWIWMDHYYWRKMLPQELPMIMEKYLIPENQGWE